MSSTPPKFDPNTREYFAYKCPLREGDGFYYSQTSPSRWWIGLHGFPYPIVEVRVRERLPTDPPQVDPKLPDYWGWLDTDDQEQYIFIWPSDGQLDMCFPYGPKAEEEVGRGRKVNLIVEEVKS